MTLYAFPALVRSAAPRYLVIWDPQWQLIDYQRLEPATDLSSAITAAIERLSIEGWQAEATPEYGFVFIRRETERRLLMLTPRDLSSTVPKSIDPLQKGRGRFYARSC
jgi:hypothetical protein